MIAGRHWSRLGLALLLLVTALWAMAWGGGALLYGPNALLSTPIVDRPSDQDALHRRLAQLQRAQRLDPFNASYHAALGRLREQAAVMAPAVGVTYRDHLRAARAHYRQAARLRPTWPYDRASIVRVTLKLGQRDQTLAHAIAAADRLGRWEAGVQRTLLEPALATWPMLPDAEQTRLMPMLEAARSMQPTWLVPTALRYRRDNLLASLIDDDPNLQGLAQRLQRTRNGD